MQCHQEGGRRTEREREEEKERGTKANGQKNGIARPQNGRDAAKYAILICIVRI